MFSVKERETVMRSKTWNAGARERKPWNTKIDVYIGMKYAGSSNTGTGDVKPFQERMPISGLAYFSNTLSSVLLISLILFPVSYIVL